jgi:REP element-mobilizing transposase RayT
MNIKHNRKSIRLHEYDYSSPGMYFITLCAQDKKCLFGDIVDDEMRLNEFGKIAQQQWLSIPNRFDDICLDEFIVMPNHMHGIIKIVGAPLAGALSNNVAPGNKRAPARGAPTMGGATVAIGVIIGAYKSLCVHQCLQYIKQNNKNLILGKLWQRNYYEHIIRNEISLNKIREYIINNPIQWQFDHYNST